MRTSLAEVGSSPKYTVQNAVDEWLAHGLDGRSAKTISTNREVLAPLTALMEARGKSERITRMPKIPSASASQVEQTEHAKCML